MLPNWLIKKIDKKSKDSFIQEQLYIEEFPFQKVEKTNKKEEIEERGIVIIDLF